MSWQAIGLLCLAVLPPLLIVGCVIPAAAYDYLIATCVEELWKEELVVKVLHDANLSFGVRVLKAILKAGNDSKLLLQEEEEDAYQCTTPGGGMLAGATTSRHVSEMSWEDRLPPPATGACTINRPLITMHD